MYIEPECVNKYHKNHKEIFTDAISYVVDRSPMYYSNGEFKKIEKNTEFLDSKNP